MSLNKVDLEIFECLKDNLKLLNRFNQLIKLVEDLKKYEKGFDILCERFDYLPDEDKPIIDEELKKVGL